MNKIFKLTLLVLLFLSLILNFALFGNLKKQDSTINYLYDYKKGYIKLIKVLGINPEESKKFLEGVEKD
tara:strand:+ start:521 stop:727 length:207 start_codon:yes stop_codon:yes gene_type:complete